MPPLGPILQTQSRLLPVLTAAPVGLSPMRTCAGGTWPARPCSPSPAPPAWRGRQCASMPTPRASRSRPCAGQGAASLTRSSPTWRPRVAEGCHGALARGVEPWLRARPQGGTDVGGRGPGEAGPEDAPEMTARRTGQRSAWHRIRPWRGTTLTKAVCRDGVAVLASGGSRRDGCWCAQPRRCRPGTPQPSGGPSRTRRLPR